MRTASVSITTDATGHGTALTDAPISGELSQVLFSGTAFGTAHVTIRRTYGGESTQLYTGVGATLPLPQPVSDGYLQVVVTGGGNRRTDTVRIVYEDE